MTKYQQSSRTQIPYIPWILAFSILAGCQPTPLDPPAEEPTLITLEQQLNTLAQLGLVLNEGVTISDLLYSWERKEYENEPFDTILFMLGSEVEREPRGRNVCDEVWNFDVECVEGTGSYVTIVENLCRVAGTPNLITDLEDFIDIENGTTWLKYTIDGKKRHYTIPVDNDWADPETVISIMKDIERDGKRFYMKDNVQASIVFYLDKNTADRLNKLTGNALKTNH